MFGLSVLILSAAFVAQAQTPSAAPSASAQPSGIVSPSQAVITMQGFCGVDAEPQDAAATHAKECATVVSREQFEQLLNALNPSHNKLAPSMERNLARSYVELMLLAAAAHQDGIERDPDYQALLNVVRMRTMADLYRRQLEEKFGNPSQQEIEAYYRQNYSSYQSLKLRTIAIPRNNLAADDQEAYERQASQLAQEIRERVVKGEDMDALQKEAYKTLGLTATPPSAEAVVKRPSEIAAESQADVVALGEGGVSKVEVERDSYVIYKVESKQTVPLDQVKKEIIAKIVQQKLNERIKQIDSAVRPTFNEQYFGGDKGPVLEDLH